LLLALLCDYRALIKRFALLRLQDSLAIAYKSIEKEDCLLLERCLLSAFCFAILARALCFAYFAMLCSNKLCAALCCLNLCENLLLNRALCFAAHYRYQFSKSFSLRSSLFAIALRLLLSSASILIFYKHYRAIAQKNQEK